MIRGRCYQIAVDGFSSLPAHLEHIICSMAGRVSTGEDRLCLAVPPQHREGAVCAELVSIQLVWTQRSGLCSKYWLPWGVGWVCKAFTEIPQLHSYQSLSQLVWRLPWRLCRSGNFLPRQSRHIPALFQPFVFSSLHLFRNMSPALFWQLHLIKNICMKNVFSSIPELALLCKESLNFPRNCSDTFSDPSLWTCMCEVVMTFPAAEVFRVT